SPYSITLADAERAELEARARRYTSPYSDVVRARIVLYASEGLGNDEAAARLDTPRQVVSKWRKRFYDERLVGLTDLPRGGRPPSFSPVRGVRAQGAGLRTAGEDRHAAGSLAVPRPGPRRRRVRHRRLDLGHRDLALAEFGCNKAVGASVLDLPPRSRLRCQGRPCPRPLRPPLRRHTAAAGRVRDLRRREDLHPGTPPQTRHHTTGAAPGDACRARIRPRRRARLPGRLGRTPRQGVRPLRTPPRHRAVRPARRAGDDLPALRLGPPGVLGGRQRLLPPRPGLHRPARKTPAPPAADSPAPPPPLA